MKITAIGLNHKTAPLDVRRRLAFDANSTLKALSRLKAQFTGAEFVLLSTCNRVELYSAAYPTSDLDAQSAAQFLARFHNVDLHQFRDHLYVHENDDAVAHLLTVASGLDSMVIGEDQIPAQLKESYSLACAARSTGKILNRLFHCAFFTSKKVRSVTSISNGRVSVAGVAVELAKQLFADIASAQTLVIGAGEMGELLIQHLRSAGCSDIAVVNRSYERAAEMARRYGIRAAAWDGIHGQLAAADMAITCASSQNYLFTRQQLAAAMNGRSQRPLLIIDIAVPRNVEPCVNDIEDVYLYSLDDLAKVAEENRRVRQEDVVKGMRIIHENVAEFMDWFRACDIGPLIGEMKQQFARISDDELSRFFVGRRANASCRDAMEPMVRRIVNRLLHCVIKNVDAVAREHGPAEAAKLVEDIIRQANDVSSRPAEPEEIEP